MRLVLPILVLLGACSAPTGDAIDDQTDEPSSRPTPSAPAPSPPGDPSPTVNAPGTEVITADSDFGTMLFDSTGQPIYLFTREAGTDPACYDDCAAAWPPVLTNGEPSGSGRVRDELLGTTRRTDGALQVTYAGHPLYFYAHEGPYQVLCHDVDEFGGTWLVVRPDGTAAGA